MHSTSLKTAFCHTLQRCGQIQRLDIFIVAPYISQNRFNYHTNWCTYIKLHIKLKLNSVALVRERTIPTERPPPVGEVSANFCG